jgi:ribosomal protein S1
MQVDEELEFMITNIDKKNQSISLSMKAFELNKMKIKLLMNIIKIMSQLEVL